MIINPYSFASFNPLSLSPALWLDASDSTTLYDATTGGSIVAPDGTIARWQDKSGNARHLTQSTGVSQPLRKAAIKNGRDIVRFDGANDFMSIASSTAMFNFLHNGTESNVFIVCKMGNSSDPNAVYSLLCNNGSSASNIGVWLSYDDRSAVPYNNAIRAFITRGVPVATNATVDGVNQDVWTPNAFTLAHWKLDADNATAANRAVMRINGGAELKSNTLTNAPSTSNAFSDMVIGAVNLAGVAPTLADLCEILIVPRAMTDGERLSTEGFFRSKWATP